ncbi:MAG: efflux RND transporter permease subunit [Candidatus Sericytochromatia bacterium]|nr:efflux RND transporter permease subunit [Candidatus Sericytochromatia bacterium]
MNISAWAIRNPIPICLLFLLLTVLGFQSYRTLGINQWPNVDFPLVVVTVARPGAAPAELETDVTRKVEDAVMGLNGLEHVRSTVVEGASTTILEFYVGTDTQAALNDARDAVSRIRQQLPADVNEPVISRPNGSGDAFISYTLASPRRSVGELSRLVDEDITRAVLTVPGVAEVQRDGGLTREVRVRLSPAKLQALGTSVDFVTGQLRALNLNLPAGKSALQDGEIGIRTLGSARNLEELKALRVPLANGSAVRLDQLGEVDWAFADVASIARLDGEPVVGFSVVRAQGAPLVQTEAGVREQVATLKKSLPPDLTLTMVRTQATFTRAAYTATIDALLLGALLAVIVIYAFLRNWQSTLISGLAIPLSVVPTFFVMSALGYSLNGMTTLALTLVVGILVDDAIVDLENIHRHIDMGKSAWQAAFEATQEIGLAVIATTMTIVAVFVPVSFMGGIPGMFFKSFGITVAVAVLLSLLVARTLTPLMAAYLLPEHRASEVHAEGPSLFKQRYLTLLRWALRHRARVMAGAVAIFIASLTLIPLIPKGFVNNGDQGEALVSIELPTGSGIAETDGVVQAATEILRRRPEVTSVFGKAGTTTGTGMGATRGEAGGVNRGQLFVTLVPRHARAIGITDWVKAVAPELRAIPGARIAINLPGAAGGGASKNINLILRGSDGVALERAAEAVLLDMRRLPDLRDVSSSAAELRPEIHIRPDTARAAEQGVLVSAIGRTARMATQGDTDINLPKFNAGDEQVNIRVQLTEAVRHDIAAIGGLLVPARQGLVPLRTVAEVTMGAGPVQINRYDRARQVTLGANLSPGSSLGDAMAKIKALPSMRNLPPGIEQGSLGEAKIMGEIFAGFGRALGMGVLLIYVVLVLLFRGFLQPATIMGALPLAIGGAFLGLLIGGKELGMMSLIGIIMLMGLVTKNSILLVEYALQARQSGLPREAALLKAAEDRVRPIMMTTIAMIAGMLPIAMSLGEGTERLSPMAMAVVGGLVTSTLLTLVIIPVAYTYVDDLASLFQRALPRAWRGRGDPGHEPQGLSAEAPNVGLAVPH